MTEVDDDWLDEAPNAPGAREDPLVDREWEKMMTKYSDAGYREGITDGKLLTLQAGFDEGFAQAVPPSRTLGLLRGRANALLQYLSSPLCDNPVNMALLETTRQLVKDLGKVRRDDVLPPDLERIAHEEEDERERRDGFELDTNDSRDMEGLESALESFGTGTNGGSRGQHPAHPLAVREEELLLSLQTRLDELETALRG